MLTSISEAKECPDCASDNIIKDYEREQLICRDCGLIFEPFSTEGTISEKKKRTKKKTKSRAKKKKPGKKRK